METEKIIAGICIERFIDISVQYNIFMVIYIYIDISKLKFFVP